VPGFLSPTGGARPVDGGVLHRPACQLRLVCRGRERRREDECLEAGHVLVHLTGGIAIQVLLLLGLVGLTRIDWAGRHKRHEPRQKSPTRP